MGTFRSKSVDVLQPLHERFPGLIAPDVYSALVVHMHQSCFLDVSRLRSPQTGSGDQQIERHDLNSWFGTDQKIFDPESSAFDTAKRLVETIGLDVFALQTSLLRAEVVDRVIKALGRSDEARECDISMEELTAAAIAEMIDQGHQRPPKWFIDAYNNS